MIPVKRRIPFMLFRGGSSKGPLILGQHVPKPAAARDRMLLDMMGSPRASQSLSAVPQPNSTSMPPVPQQSAGLQLDGLGGGRGVTSKALVVSKSTERGIDVDYLVCEVRPNEPVVDTSIDCGNMLAAVAPFAIEQGLVQAHKGVTKVRIRSQNTKMHVVAEVPTPNGRIAYQSSRSDVDRLDSGAKIKLEIQKPGGTTCGKVLPTGKAQDIVDGVPISCVDVSMPLVIVRASDLGLTGFELPTVLDKDPKLMERVETLRRAGGRLMGCGDVTGQISPKICMVAPSRDVGDVQAVYFIAPFRRETHPTMAVTGALCLSGAAVTAGTLVHELVQDKIRTVRGHHALGISHPGGLLETWLNVGVGEDGAPEIQTAGYARTARLLAEGDMNIFTLAARRPRSRSRSRSR